MIVAASATDILSFCHNLSTAHWDSQGVRKVNKKNGISMLNATLSINQIYVMIVPYGIPSQKKQAKEGLTLRLKLDHFPTLNKDIYLLDL